MITVVNTQPPTYYGMSQTDSKPTDDRVENGSKFVEIDTQEEFRFDAEGRTWYGKPVPDAN